MRAIVLLLLAACSTAPAEPIHELHWLPMASHMTNITSRGEPGRVWSSRTPEQTSCDVVDYGAKGECAPIGPCEHAHSWRCCKNLGGVVTCVNEERSVWNR